MIRGDLLVVTDPGLSRLGPYGTREVSGGEHLPVIRSRADH